MAAAGFRPAGFFAAGLRVEVFLAAAGLRLVVLCAAGLGVEVFFPVAGFCAAGLPVEVFLAAGLRRPAGFCPVDLRAEDRAVPDEVLFSSEPLPVVFFVGLMLDPFAIDGSTALGRRTIAHR